MKYYINGEERSKKAFQALDYEYNPLIHYAIISEKSEMTIEWGRVPKLIIAKGNNE